MGALDEDVDAFLTLMNSVGSKYLDIIENGHNLNGSYKPGVGRALRRVEEEINDLRSFLGRLAKKISPSESGPYGDPDDGVGAYINALETVDSSYRVTKTPKSTSANISILRESISGVEIRSLSGCWTASTALTADPGGYGVITILTSLLRLDAKFLGVLYTLDMHESFRSPITNTYYSKERRGGVTDRDVKMAVGQVVDLVRYALKFVSHMNMEAYNREVKKYFSLDSFGRHKPVDRPLVVYEESNVPAMLYGDILTLCEVIRQASEDAPKTTGMHNDNVDVRKVVDLAVNCTYGVLTVGSLVEGLLKSLGFSAVMSVVFPATGTLDTQLYLRQVVDGPGLIDESKIVPSPLEAIPSGQLFCEICVTICGISRFLYNSGSVCASTIKEVGTLSSRSVRVGRSTTDKASVTDGDIVPESLIMDNGDILTYLKEYIRGYAKSVRGTNDAYMKATRRVLPKSRWGTILEKNIDE